MPIKSHHLSSQISIQPLSAYARDVLGADAPGLLREWREAYAETDSGLLTGKSFIGHARVVLRTCAKLDGVRRRVRYVEKAIRNLRSIPEEDDNEPPFPALKEKLGEKVAGDLFNQLFDVYGGAFPGKPEKVGANVERLLRNAVQRKWPDRYLRACIKNQQATNDRKQKERSKS